MFDNLVRGILVAATVATGVVGLGAAPASAETRIIVREDARIVPVQYRDRYERGYRRGDTCSARLAIRKAYDLGLNRPRVVRETRRAVVVDGMRRGRIQTVRFANDYGCPVLSIRR